MAGANVFQDSGASAMPLTAFGELAVSQLTTMVAWRYDYSINPALDVAVGENITVGIQDSSTTATDVAVSIGWEELF